MIIFKNSYYGDAMSKNGYMKYDFLTKELLEKEIKELKSINKISAKYNINYFTIRKYFDYYKINYTLQTKPICDHNFFKQETEEVFYVAGFLAADGWINKSDGANTLGLALKTEDKKHIEMIRDLFKSNHIVRDRFNKIDKNKHPTWNDTYGSYLHISSKQMLEDLQKFNIIERKTKIYKFPKWLINHPLVHHFMRGYHDGDGCIYYDSEETLKNKQKPGTISQAHFELRGTVDFLKYYAKILNRETTINRPNKHIVFNVTGKLKYGGNKIVSKISNYLYKDATIFLPRKYELIKNFLPKELVLPYEPDLII